MKIVTIVGARPQFIKAVPLTEQLRDRCTNVLIHSGQHYDPEMSDVFFKELGLPSPDYRLSAGSSNHGDQTGKMLAGIEDVLIKERPDVVVVFGDTNTTLAGALAAAKLQMAVAHVEAGLRSFNRTMPEEINRVLTDHLSSWLFAPSNTAKENLSAEGIRNGVHIVGDIMVDALRSNYENARRESTILARLGLTAGSYYAATLHRAENVDQPQRLHSLVRTLGELNAPVVLPLHPRTRARLAEFSISPGGVLRFVDPLGYLDMLWLVANATCVLTDSGGLQKESYVLGVPCVTLREETEWVETVVAGWNILAGLDATTIHRAVDVLRRPPRDRPQLYGDGHTAERIAKLLVP